MKKILSIVVMVLLGVTSAWAEQVTVNLYHSKETTTSSYIDQSVSGACNPIGSLWGDGFMQFNKDGDWTGGNWDLYHKNQAQLTFSAKKGTILSSYHFEIVPHTDRHQPRYQINNNGWVSITESTTSVSTTSYTSSSLILYGEASKGRVSQDKRFPRFKNFVFNVTIPDVLKIDDDREKTTSLGAIIVGNEPITKETKLRFVVKDPIDVSKLNEAYFTLTKNVPAGWAIGAPTFKEPEIFDNSTYYVDIPISFTATTTTATGEYQMSLKLAPVNEFNQSNTFTHIVKVSVGQKGEYPVDWCDEWLDEQTSTGTVTLYKGVDYIRNDYLKNHAGLSLVSPYWTKTDDKSGDIFKIADDGTISVLDANRTAILTYVQPENEEYNQKTLTINVKTDLRTPQFTLHSDATYVDENGEMVYVFYVNKEYPSFVTSTNGDYAHYQLSMQTDITDNQDMYVHFDGISANMMSVPKENIKLTVTQKGGALWHDAIEEFNIAIRENPIHVGTLCNRSITDLYDDPLCKGDFDNAEKGADKVVLGSTRGGSTGGYIVFRFMGAPDKVQLHVKTTDVKTSGANATWTISCSEDGESFTQIHSVNLGENQESDIEASLNNIYARYVKIAISGTEIKGEISDLCITEKVGFEVDPTTVNLVRLADRVASSKFTATVSNLTALDMVIEGSDKEDFSLSCGSHTYDHTSGILLDYTDGLGIDKTAAVPVTVNYIGDFTDIATLQAKQAQVKVFGGGIEKIVAINITEVELSGDGIPKEIYLATADATGIYTGTALTNLTKAGFYTSGTVVPRKPVYLANTFDEDGNALFDELYVFGETVSSDGKTTMTAATATAVNTAVTPCYVFTKGGNDHYDYVGKIDNVNVASKQLPYNSTNKYWSVADGTSRKLYFTGFCPFGSNGFTKNDEGIIYVKGGAGSSVDIYLEDCQLYSRQHTQFGDAKSKEDIETFDVNPIASGEYAGSGSASAIVFECTSGNNLSSPFKATIHTMGDNVLYSQLGCSGNFLSKKVGQYCASLQVRSNISTSCTVLSFDDKWPTSNNTHKRTNGYLRFQKSSGNSPSIDFGNANSIVNFNGGRIELQNSTSGAQYYTNIMAICYRGGYANIGSEINVGMGLGGDEVGGTVNFNDGTVNAIGTGALKCPKNTYIKGGSHNSDILSMSSLTSTGGSPTDGISQLVKLDLQLLQDQIDENGLAKPGFFPSTYVCEGCANDGTDLVVDLDAYYAAHADNFVGGTYGSLSVAPDKSNYVHLWIPGKGKTEKNITPWVVAMPQFKTETNVAGQPISIAPGGNQTIPAGATNVVNNLLFGYLDTYMQGQLNMVKTSAGYKIPIRVTNTYHEVDLTDYDGTLYANVLNNEDYTIEQSIYYMRAVNADEWYAFCPPFDISEVYVLETCNETLLESEVKNSEAEDARDQALIKQADHNVDFAALTLGSIHLTADETKSFDTHFNSFEWYAADQKATDEYYNSSSIGMHKLTHFTAGNYNANYFLYQSTGLWKYDETGFTTDWTYATPINKIIGNATRSVLMEAGKVYAMQFPYCPGCEMEGEMRYDWDYWTGKIIIFKGYGPQTLKGTNAHALIQSEYTNELTMDDGTYPALLRGNATGSEVQIPNSTTLAGYSYFNLEGSNMFEQSNVESAGLLPPGGVFMLLPPDDYSPVPSAIARRIKSINLSTGSITYVDEEGDSEDGTTTNIPTISGNRQMMVYNVAGGVGIVPVVEQQVSIYNAAGQLVTSQYLTDEVHISLPTGIYLIAGAQDQFKAVVK